MTRTRITNPSGFVIAVVGLVISHNSEKLVIIVIINTYKVLCCFRLVEG